MADTIQFLTVEEEDNGTRCDRFLAGKLPDLSRSRIQELIAEGAVQIDGKTVKSSRKMMEGETVEIRIPDPEVPEIRPEAIPLDILYEDNDLLIVNKPKGMTVNDRTSGTGTPGRDSCKCSSLSLRREPFGN